VDEKAVLWISCRKSKTMSMQKTNLQLSKDKIKIVMEQKHVSKNKHRVHYLLAAADSLFSTAELPRARTKRTKDDRDVINSILQTGLIHQSIFVKQKQEKNGFAQKPNN
jgi:hypothetical protein